MLDISFARHLTQLINVNNLFTTHERKWTSVFILVFHFRDVMTRAKEMMRVLRLHQLRTTGIKHRGSSTKHFLLATPPTRR